MAADVAGFEKATLTAFYYTIQRGVLTNPIDESLYNVIKANPKASGLSLYKTKEEGGGTSNRTLAQAMLIEYPSMSYDGWYKGILRGCKTLMDYIGHIPGNTDTSWYYGRFGDKGGFDKVGEIPDNAQNGVLDEIWNNFAVEQQRQVGSKKDTWNPADVYMVQRTEVTSIINDIHHITCTGDHKDKQEACLGILAVNAYLSNLIQEKVLLGISLKQATPNAMVRITETNFHADPDILEGLRGGIDGDIKQVMKIDDVAARHPNFDTNSMTFTARFTPARDAPFAFIYESKISSADHHASETRSKTTNIKTGKEINHKARNGSVPTPRLSQLIRHYIHEQIGYNIPTTRKFNASEKRYWTSKMENLKPNSQLKNEGGDFNFGGPNAFKVDNVQKSRKEFMDIALNLYTGNPKRKGTSQQKYDLELISKLRSLRYFEMFNAAAVKGELGELMARLYFMSSKINVDQGDLAGPFLKLQ
tara:strand:+ start:85 stop:1509 length:1425 start_codon:yes stop_codon:yes gene_type:complete